MSSGPFSNLQKGGAGASGNEELGKTRRRLSVVSDNKLVEGLAGLQTEDQDAAGGSCCVSAIVDVAGVSKKGYAPYNPRKKNQDILIMEPHDATNTMLLAVFDGHGEAGDGVSQFFQAQLPPTLFSHPEFAAAKGTADEQIQAMQQALSEAVMFLEKNLLKDSSIDTEFSGTTAVINMVRNIDGDTYVVCGNIGDSRITRGTTDGSRDQAKSPCLATPISFDHKPETPDEKARIIAAGGRVFAVEYDDGIDGPHRVWLGHMDVPGLAMSRSLGDTVAHSAGVSSEPEYTVHKLTADDKYLIVASDGLWEFMTDQEVVDICAQQTDARRTVDLLIMEANGRWMKEEQVIDDTTVIVAHIDTSK